jgi:mannose-6-phosphate isomerase-like protein (cupin superfamily)
MSGVGPPDVEPRPRREAGDPGSSSACDIGRKDECACDPDGLGAALHIHDTFDVGFDVLAGELAFQVDDDVVTGGPGAFAWVARGTPHTLAHLSGHHARTLVLCSPAGFESDLDRLIAALSGTAAAERSPAEEGTQSVWGNHRRSHQVEPQP